VILLKTETKLQIKSIPPKKVRHFFLFIPISLDAEEFLTNWEESVEKFDDLGLKEQVLRGVYGYGFVKPSPIQ